jgi:hypothetical protein
MKLSEEAQNLCLSLGFGVVLLVVLLGAYYIRDRSHDQADLRRAVEKLERRSTTTKPFIPAPQVNPSFEEQWKEYQRKQELERQRIEKARQEALWGSEHRIENQEEKWKRSMGILERYRR